MGSGAFTHLPNPAFGWDVHWNSARPARQKHAKTTINYTHIGEIQESNKIPSLEQPEENHCSGKSINWMPGGVGLQPLRVCLFPRWGVSQNKWLKCIKSLMWAWFCIIRSIYFYCIYIYIAAPCCHCFGFLYWMYYNIYVYIVYIDIQ